MRRLTAALILVASLIASATAAPPSMKDLVFLSRDGCVNTARMRANLDGALKALKLSTDYQFVDADRLKTSDPKRGYGTPTVLYKGRDLFGMPEPPARDHAPT